MVYDLLSNGAPAYWIINPDKANKDAIDFSIVKGGASAAVQIIQSKALTSSGSLAQVDYRGGPFVIDANDLTPEIKSTAENIIRNIYKSAKVHIANYDFSAPVDKVLSGTPPKVAVLGEGATQVLLDYLKASGLGNRVFAIFQSVTSQQIINGILSDFQLLWAPHWIVETEVKVQADRDKVLSAIRSFLEKGNAGFFECASIESLESSIQIGGKTPKTSGLDSQISGGFLTDRTYKAPRIDVNNGSMNLADMVFENPAFYLDQCSGWKFQAQGGHIHNFRPRKDTTTAGYPLQPTSPYKYNSTVSRFIHDRDNYAYGVGIPASPPGYDYFVGGRINGTATQGYLAYLAGHRYIQCTNADQPVPTDRLFDLYFDRDIGDLSKIADPVVTIEAVYSGCTQGVNCPKLTYDIANPVEDIANDGKIFVQSEGAIYDPATKKLSSITIGNLTTSNQNITGIIVTFPTDLLPPGPDKQTLLTKVIDVTNPSVPATICSPNTASASTCTPTSTLTLGSLVTSCAMDWSKSNTCGIRYVLNTLLGLQFQIVPNEYNKASPIVKDNVLYKGTFEYPGYKGHLYALDVMNNSILWDAGKYSAMPPAGSTNPGTPTRTNATRYIFTNVPGTTTKLNFEDGNASTLKYFAPQGGLDPTNTKSLNWARALISLVRGRYDATEGTPLGTKDVKKRLGGIEHSTPAVFQRSSVIRDSIGNIIDRDKIVFVGAHDGMLHAVYAGAWDSTMNGGKGGYTQGTGKEIWAYIPSTLLPSLQNQTFTDCNPGDYVQGCDPNVDPNKCVCPTFPVAVSVDSSPAIGDFFVDHDNDPNTPNVWKTILVGTAVILSPGLSQQSVNQGIVFALDITDPYVPKVLWERTYGIKVDPALQKIERHYYPTVADYNNGFFTASYITAEDSLFDINMGNSKGTAVGRVQVGTKLNTYIFLTSKWINQVNTGTAALPHNVWGLSATALDFRTGDIVWETKILYTGDSEGINETPAIPALMDVDDTGTQDYLAFGDMQGRLWILRTSDGKSLTGDTPAYVVKDSNGMPVGAKEPIGSSVSVFRNYIVFGTGARDSLTDESNTKFRVYALQVTPSGVVSIWKDNVSGKDTPIELNAGEKVWSPPLMDSGGHIYIATGKGYSDVGRPDLVRTGSTGRFILADRATGAIQGTPITLPGAVVGGIDIENKHAYVITFDGAVVQIGGNDFTPSGSGNPIKILWWKKL
ncbi:MAG: hypothetical protein M1508_08700 [Nitrospirae bacterium]|nr:hypothetical protein [Nitrospirota bacterium]